MVREAVEDHNQRFMDALKARVDHPDERIEAEPRFLGMSLGEWEKSTRSGPKNGTCADNYVTFETIAATKFGLTDAIERYRKASRKAPVTP